MKSLKLTGFKACDNQVHNFVPNSGGGQISSNGQMGICQPGRVTGSPGHRVTGFRVGSRVSFDDPIPYLACSISDYIIIIEIQSYTQYQINFFQAINNTLAQ